MPPDDKLPSPANGVIDPAELRAHDTWFTVTVDPWDEIVLLEPGADRTGATTVQRALVHAPAEQRSVFEKKLLATLNRPELTENGREFVCRMLALVGSGECVPAIAPLLASPHTNHWARIALDPISDPRVDAAYREALERLDGDPLIGVVGSIASRGDHGAVERLRAIAADGKRAAAVRAVADRAAQRLTKEAQS